MASSRLVALFQAIDEVTHVRAQRREEVIGILAVVQHQATEELGADNQRRALIAGQATLYLKGRIFLR